jgi:hypothetical protein
MGDGSLVTVQPLLFQIRRQWCFPQCGRLPHTARQMRHFVAPPLFGRLES